MTTTIDLRSDTVTRPSADMRTAMANAVVGDDVMGADPTAIELQEFAAEVLGKEAAIFMPSGTMTNQIALRVHCQPGDEFICDAGCHVYNYEQGAFAQLSQLVAKTVEGERGIIKLEQTQNLIRRENDHFVRTRLVCLENTHNRGGGAIYPFEEVTRVCDWAHANGLITHLDGARLFNAVVETGIPASKWAEHFDSVSICLSKGLGAPVGSVLAGTEDAIYMAKRHRKLFGGGMRQCGVIAAAGLYALKNNVERLADDHAKAKRLAQFIEAKDGLSLTFGKPDTNILFVDIDVEKLGSADDVVARLADKNVIVLAESDARLRALTHLDVTNEQIEQAGQAFAAL
ncbi:MAG: aminotransferase class I/II-fold pyridoxal phosphate-dependent enzyme [Planctomycetales bacterium]|nr:aminotransferase class I/II-fold pyridoxal phosphate-dependent enzyme [Planctomycetales bacterium]